MMLYSLTSICTLHRHRSPGTPRNTPKNRKTHGTGTPGTPRKTPKTPRRTPGKTPTKRPAEPAATAPVPTFQIKGHALQAKQNKVATHEGRLEDDRTRALKKGSRVVYKYGTFSTSFCYILTADPVVHATVKAGIYHAGWESLMPFAGSRTECHVRYVELFTGAKHTIQSAVDWDTACSKRFVTWPDEPSLT